MRVSYSGFCVVGCECLGRLSGGHISFGRIWRRATACHSGRSAKHSEPGPIDTVSWRMSGSRVSPGQRFAFPGSPGMTSLGVTAGSVALPRVPGAGRDPASNKEPREARRNPFERFARMSAETGSRPAPGTRVPCTRFQMRSADEIDDRLSEASAERRRSLEPTKIERRSRTASRGARLVEIGRHTKGTCQNYHRAGDYKSGTEPTSTKPPVAGPVVSRWPARLRPTRPSWLRCVAGWA